MSIPPPRAIAPLSTATVTSELPILRWSLVGGDDGAVVEICRDRACTMSVLSFTAKGTSGVPTTALTGGLYYWRLRGTLNGAVGSKTSPTWEFFVGARSAPVNTSWGTTLDVNGDGLADVIVGAPEASNRTGAAYVYLAGSGGVSITPTTLASPAGPSGAFGSSVASAGDVNGDGFADVIVGALAANAYVGAAYVYLGGLGGLSTTPITLSSPSGPSGLFGASVASAGDVNGDGFADVIVGAPGTGVGAYIYLGSASGPLTMPLVLQPPGRAAAFGESVASAGDVNGDGFADVIVGAPQTTDGAVYIYLGKAVGISRTPEVLTAPGNPQSLDFGNFAASAGDVNGDGFADVVVGSSAYGGNGVYVYLGGAGGLSMAPTALPNGHSVASAGDVNGDGYGDVVLGSAASGSGGFAYLGGIGGLSQTPEILTVPSGPLSTPGYSVAGAGDVNGDGFADVLVGAPSSGAGGVYVFLGAAGGLSPMPSLVVTGPSPGTGFGASVASAEGRTGVGDSRMSSLAQRDEGKTLYAASTSRKAGPALRVRSALTISRSSLRVTKPTSMSARM
jgi:hypothetical protein